MVTNVPQSLHERCLFTAQEPKKDIVENFWLHSSVFSRTWREKTIKMCEKSETTEVVTVLAQVYLLTLYFPGTAMAIVKFSICVFSTDAKELYSCFLQPFLHRSSHYQKAPRESQPENCLCTLGFSTSL